VEACGKFLPAGTQFTKPQGGMNLWVRLPEPLDAGELLARAEREGVTYLPGKFFGVSKIEAGCFRISFAGVEPSRIEAGLAKLGKVFSEEVDRVRELAPFDSVPAMV
ncbi:MAG: aminotransferase class I/II-fold pyridoxal phosphate-dependent enzyme, partial [Acidobacteriaceae bacterium]|nr:aminotransferase class I/II-fold pyridoxal phosphate-dependent enzyme [Acidobacteriaceae bacterium]